MTDARRLLDEIRTALAPEHHENRLVPLIADGAAPLSVIGALAAEEHRIVRSDWRSFLTLAARSEDPAGRTFFGALAQGEALALPTLAPLAVTCGMDDGAVDDYRPQPGCQAYPAYLAWLALNADPAAATLAILTNFAAWGTYCATIAEALRRHHGFPDEACAFFDFFATPTPELEEQGVVAVQAALDAGRLLDEAREYGRLLQAYELMFWNTLADQITNS